MTMSTASRTSQQRFAAFPMDSTLAKSAYRSRNDAMSTLGAVHENPLGRLFECGREMTDLNHRYDVLVIGGGNAALCAAISARRSGASVLVLEAATKFYRGGN